jgi:glycosyltransferase involved in cell wall biosynthesis
MNPLISIITPSFNQGHLIEYTIKSVLEQSYQNIQYIVVDGGSTDGTAEVLSRYVDKIDIIIQEKDRGQSDAINKGFKLAKGELIGWINSDDLIESSCVEKIVKLYSEFSDGVVYYGNKLKIIDERGDFIRLVKIKTKNFRYLLNFNYSIIQQGSFYRKSDVMAVGYLDVNLHYCMDLDLWLKLLKYGKIYSVDEAIASFRIYNGTKTTEGGEGFLLNIKETLSKHGLILLSMNNIRLFIYLLKVRTKIFLGKIYK